MPLFLEMPEPVEECDTCHRVESGLECEVTPCHACGDTFRDCEGSCSNGCEEVS